jgi:hypothetical protein
MAGPLKAPSCNFDRALRGAGLRQDAGFALRPSDMSGTPMWCSDAEMQRGISDVVLQLPLAPRDKLLMGIILP